MEPEPFPSLQMPSFLHGSSSAIHRKTQTEGRRCSEQYRKDGSLPTPSEMLEVPPGEVVLAHEAVDFQRERPAWRLYMTSKVISGLCEALDWQNSFHVGDLYEASCRETAWGALYVAISQDAPRSTERTALRLQALLRFWEPLQSVRYLFSTPNRPLTLEELMVASHDWAMDAWCPSGEGSVRARLERAAERMAGATREDCIEAILREMPRALAHAQGLKHRDVLTRPDLLRQRFATLGQESFERVSGACTADLMAQLYAWDRQIEKQ